MLTPDVLIKQLKWRYAVKKFDAEKKIPQATWHALEESLVLAPSSFGLQPWKFIVVKDPALRTTLFSASWKQKQVVDASHMVVFTFRKDLNAADIERFITHTATVREVAESTLEGYKQIMLGWASGAGKHFDMNVWSMDQVYIALGTFMAAAAVLGIDTCPMEGIDRPKYDEILGLDKTGFRTAVVATAGYRSTDDKYASSAKVRYPHAEIIEHR